MNVRCCVTWWVKVCDDDDVVVTVTMMSLQKKKEKSRIEYDIDGRKIEFWMKKITALMTRLFDVSMFNVNSNNEQQWINNE